MGQLILMDFLLKTLMSHSNVLLFQNYFPRVFNKIQCPVKPAENFNFLTFWQSASIPVAKSLAFQKQHLYSCELTTKYDMDPLCHMYPLVAVNKYYSNFILGHFIMPPPPPYWWLSQWYLWRWYQWQQYYLAVHYGKSYTNYMVLVLM